MQNLSPRLDVPGIDDVYTSLDADLTADIVVVGGGIAGCMAAYFLLHNTDRSVMLIEGERIARGASGHNAGQIDVFFETPIGELVKTYGMELTRDAYRAMFDAWRQIDEVVQTIDRQGQYVKYIGYNTFTTREQLWEICKELALFDAMGLEVNELFVDADQIISEEIPTEYISYVNFITREQGNEYLGSDTIPWICFEATHYATLNSAAFCHAILRYLCATFPERCAVYEETMVATIQTAPQLCTLTTTSGPVIHCQDCILATNAYTHHTIIDHADVSHASAVAGYMTAYAIPTAKAPMTVCVQPVSTNDRTDDYYYHSARHMTTKDFTEHTMVCVGGPDVDVQEAVSRHVTDVPVSYAADLDRYIGTFYATRPDRAYERGGIMAYTDTGVRKIGPHPTAPHVRYSVGCNGVGLLSSVHGAWKLSQLLQGIRMPQSVFDIT